MAWIPYPGGQTEFLSRSEFEVLYGGRAGPGKTACVVAGMLRGIEHPRYHGLLIRRTFPQLQEIIDRCWQMYPLLGGVYRVSEKRWTFPSGSRITLGHMQHEDSKYDYQGKEFNRIGPDELTQFTESQYLYLISRLRRTDPDPLLAPQIISTTNPGGIGHQWVKDRFVTITKPGQTYWDPKSGHSRVFIEGRREDNPALFENDPGYESRLELLPEVERLRLKDGIWDAFEGQVFTELSQRLHGCEDFDVPPEWERYCVFDWGFSKPFCVHWYAMDYDGVAYLYREWYGCKKETEGGEADTGLRMQAWEVARGILEREKGEKIRMRIADPSIWHPRPDARRAESRGVTIHEDMTNQGVYFLKADNDRAHGKMQVHKRLRVEQIVDQETGEITDEMPMFRAFNSCAGFWRTLPMLREDPKNPEDIDTDLEDHPYDCTRYFCMARPVKPRRIPAQVKGSFQSERARLIRAKTYARRHGVSVEAAYNRIS